MLLETVAETSDELLEKFFGGEELTVAEVNQALIADPTPTPPPEATPPA